MGGGSTFSTSTSASISRRTATDGSLYRQNAPMLGRSGKNARDQRHLDQRREQISRQVPNVLQHRRVLPAPDLEAPPPSCHRLPSSSEDLLVLLFRDSFRRFHVNDRDPAVPIHQHHIRNMMSNPGAICTDQPER